MYQTSHLGDRRVSEQFALFESPASEPKGLHYLADFVSAETEQKLISGILDLPLQPFQFGQFQGEAAGRFVWFSRRLRLAALAGGGTGPRLVG
jgi:hypothetical protein